MRTRVWKIVGLLAFVAVLLLITGCRVVTGGDSTLEQGETVRGDLVLLGGNVKLEEKSKVTGDMFSLGGNAEINGEIDGDVTVLGGSINLGSKAVVHGGVRTLGGNVNRAPGARIEGGISDERIERFEGSWGFDTPEFFEFGWLWFLLQSFIGAIVAVLVVMVFPQPTERVARAVWDQPLIAGGMGILTMIVAPIVLVLLLITIIGPLVLLVALGAAMVFGWIALGMEMGRRLAQVVKWDLHPAVAAGLGTLLLSLVANGIGFIPYVGWVAPLFVTLLGLGGVVLTRFGFRTYVRVPATVSVESVDGPSPEK